MTATGKYRGNREGVGERFQRLEITMVTGRSGGFLVTGQSSESNRRRFPGT